MGFIGIFILGLAGLALFLFIIGAILFVFIPCLIIAIVNLVKGSINHWPKRNVIPLIITGSIALIFILLFIVFMVFRFSSSEPTTTSSASTYVQAMLPLI